MWKWIRSFFYPEPTITHLKRSELYSKEVKRLFMEDLCSVEWVNTYAPRKENNHYKGLWMWEHHEYPWWSHNIEVPPIGGKDF